MQRGGPAPPIPQGLQQGDGLVQPALGAGGLAGSGLQLGEEAQRGRPPVLVTHPLEEELRGAGLPGGAPVLPLLCGELGEGVQGGGLALGVPQALGEDEGGTGLLLAPLEACLAARGSGADAEPGILLGRWHRQAEELVEGSGATWTHLRPGAYMTNFLTYSRPDEHGNIYMPIGDGASSFVDPRDIADCAAAVLTGEGHEGRSYVLTGPEALTIARVAGHIGEATGRQVNYVDVPEGAARGAMEGMGAPGWMVQGLVVRGRPVQRFFSKSVVQYTNKERTMPGYFILTHRIDDLERYQAEYIPNVMPIIFKYGGEIVAGGAELQPLEGNQANAVAVIKFPSVEKAEAAMSDPDYQPYKKLRHELTSNYSAMIVPHFEMPAG